MGKAEGSLPARYQNGMAKGRQTSNLAASGLVTKDVQGPSLQAYSSSKKSALTLHPAQDSQPIVTSFCLRDCSVPTSRIQARLTRWRTCPWAAENELAHVNQSLKILKSIREASAGDCSLQVTLSPTPTPIVCQEAPNTRPSCLSQPCSHKVRTGLRSGSNVSARQTITFLPTQHPVGALTCRNQNGARP